MFKPLHQAALRTCDFFVDEDTKSILNTPITQLWKATEAYDTALELWRKSHNSIIDKGGM